MTYQELILYYKNYLELKKNNGVIMQWAKDNNLNVKTFQGFCYRIDPWVRKYKHLKEKDLEMAHLYKVKGESRDSFCKKFNITISRLNSALCHIHYYQRLKKLLPEYFKEEPSFTAKRCVDILDNQFSFINVTEQQQISPDDTHQEPLEVIKPLNQLELTIKEGVKVTVSNEIKSEKILQIIDFLRNL